MALDRLLPIGFCAGVLVVAAWTQPLGKGVIAGAVVDGESGDAIHKAVVTLTLEGTPRRWATTRTDGLGRFQFEGLPTGKYDLRATKADEGTAIYGANTIRELGDLITLGDGETRGDIKLRMIRAASISGRVYDSDGEPVANVNVSLLRPGRNLGAPILANYRGAQTDDHGEYRIPNVDPGQYYVHASPPRTGRFGQISGDGEPMLVDQYYGGARDSKDASPVHVRGGESLAGLDFRLASEPAVEVKGRILGIPEEFESHPQPQELGRLVAIGGEIDMPGIQVTVSPVGAEPQIGWMSTIAQGPEHSFQLPDMPAGRYRVDAVLRSGSKAYGASQIFDLHPGSGEVTLTLAPAATIQGTLRIEGKGAREEGPTASRPGNGISVQLERPGTVRSNLSAQVGADGRFSIGPVPPGEWQLNITPVSPGFLKAAHLGDKDVRFTTFELGANADAALNIVVSMRTATVEGAIDAESPHSKRAGIVIAPVGQYHNLIRLYHTAAADDDGKFKVEGVAPGQYKIFALEKMAARNFRTPEALDPLDELGEVLEVVEGAKLQAHPKLIPLERLTKVLP